MPNWFHSSRWMGAIVTVFVALVLFAKMDKGWIPHDEGLLGQSAQRILAGELPHMEFADPYTGGQAMLHAIAFRALGVSLISMRWVLFVFSIAFAFVLFLIASRFAKPPYAAAITIAAIAWSVPNYFAGLPSWYNLFFAVFGTWALIKYDESENRVWLLIAGLFGAFSFLFKVAGLYFVAASLLFLVFHNQQASDGETERKSGWSFYGGFCFVSLALFCLALLSLVRQRLTLMNVLHFVVPGVLLSGYLVLSERKVGAENSWSRLRRLLVTTSWFVIGFIVPIGLFLVPYLARGGVGDFFHGVFVLPQKRMEWTDYPLPAPNTLVAVLPVLLLLLVPLWVSIRRIPVWITSFGALLACFVVVCGSIDTVYTSLWNSTRPMVPVVVLAGLLTLWKTGKESQEASSMTPDAKPIRPTLVFLILAMVSMVSLVQYPYAFGIYFCYVAPLVVLAWVAIVQAQSGSPKQIHFIVLLLFFGFASVWLNRGHIRRIGTRYVFSDQATELKLDLAGISVSESNARLYKDVIEEVMRHSSAGDYIYATQDCPEIYFLSDRRNPFPTFYEFFEEDFRDSDEARQTRIMKALEEKQVSVIVFHWNGEFSGALPMEFAGQMAQQYPNVKHFLRNPASPNGAPVFSVAWK